LRLNVKLKQNPDLAKEVIDMDNIPLKDLIINKNKATSSKGSKTTEATKKKISMETRQSKRQRMAQVDVLLEVASTLS